ncbi:MAG TPA: putative LPS assembly protein LptD [Rhodothermales bacterium]|nr:putative LPS assembly protein LptD [Rhodothermales bacterium]
MACAVCARLKKQRLHLACLAFLLASYFAPPAAAQQRDTVGVQVVQPDSASQAPGPVSAADTSSLAPADSLSPPDPENGTSSLDEPVKFSSSDSLVIRFNGEDGDVGTLYGNAKVNYGDATLQAHKVAILFGIDELRASGLPADTGMVGRPQFEQGSESFSGDRLAYNMRTERGRAVGARTSMQEGFIRGGVVKVTEDSTLYVKDGLYTTCNCIDDPSYSLRSNRMKVVNKKWVYTGPIQLFLFNIPTPLWLPFGFLPATEQRRSGPLPPQYGEDERGFYLRDWGWYWAINDYMDAQLRFGIWTRGSWQIAPSYRYSKRYRYSGQIGIDYVHNRTGEHGDPDYAVRTTSSIRWNHNQTLSPSATFGANVDLSSSGYLHAISENYDDRVRNSIGSSIRYSKRWRESQRSFNVSVTQRQVLSSGQTNFTFPNLSFSQGSRKPFARSVQTGRERWYERITYSYNGTLQNQYNFNPLRDETLIERGDTAALGVGWWEALWNPDLYRRATGSDQQFNFSAQHSIPVSASFSVTRLPIINKTLRLNISTSVNYDEDWYISTYRKAFEPPDPLDSTAAQQGTVVTTHVPGFFSYRHFSTGLSANTTFYGLFPFKVGPFNGFRHTVRPTLGFSFTPDYGSDFWGYTRTYTDLNGDLHRYNIATGQELSPYGSGRQESLTFGVSNVFETKLARKDTSDASQSRTLKLLSVDLNGSYNLAADSLRFSPLSISARTDILDKLHLTFRSTLSPYATDSTGRLLNQYVFSPRSLHFLRLERLSLSARTSFSSSEAKGGRPVSSPRINPTMQTLTGGAYGGYDPNDPFNSPYQNSPVGYADFAIPWSLNLDFTYSLTNTGRSAVPGNHVATLNTSFDFNLTPNWKVQGRSGFDLVRQDIVTTSLNVYRDFECWQMSFNWIPIGRFQSYGFDLHVKSGKLRDLLRIRQPRSDVRGRFGG